MKAGPSSRSGVERRSEPRIACNNTPAEFTIVDHRLTTISAVVTDLSKSGLKILANTRTSPGQQVRIKMEKLIIFGEVRHCCAQGAMFEAGVKISDVVGENGICDRLTDEQIELLALGKGLSVGERIVAQYHVRRCRPCQDQFQATKRFFAKLNGVRGSGVKRSADQRQSTGDGAY